jgi:hypothetical protein
MVRWQAIVITFIFVITISGIVVVVIEVLQAVRRLRSHATFLTECTANERITIYQTLCTHHLNVDDVGSVVDVGGGARSTISRAIDTRLDVIGSSVTTVDVVATVAVVDVAVDVVINVVRRSSCVCVSGTSSAIASASVWLCLLGRGDVGGELHSSTAFSAKAARPFYLIGDVSKLNGIGVVASSGSTKNASPADPSFIVS